MTMPAAPTVAAPSATPTPEFTPSQPVVQATPPIEERIAAATAAAEAEQAATAAAKPRPAAVRTAERPAATARSAAAAPAAAASVAPIETPAPAGPAAESTPVPTVAPVATATPVAQATASTDQALLWAMGGGALLLLGLGGAALMRRRRTDKPVEAYVEPMAVPVRASDPVMAAPAPVAPRSALASTSHGDATLEAMVAAAPSADNPFLTRTKRLRRAQHLLAQREAVVATAAPQTNSCGTCTYGASRPQPDRLSLRRSGDAFRLPETAHPLSTSVT
ncbi:hypothetical protein [Sphingomonas sp. VDB2]|uniref:hypothetical protein n=1 Tax=Sphingomonas sp. VDB2 TaxID=3228751 RepID=UPI003A7FFAB8